MRNGFRVALTGGIASGKTTVADLFAALGATIIDTDLLAREVVAPGTALLAEIAAQYGQSDGLRTAIYPTPTREEAATQIRNLGKA